MKPKKNQTKTAPEATTPEQTANAQPEQTPEATPTTPEATQAEQPQAEQTPEPTPKPVPTAETPEVVALAAALGIAPADLVARLVAEATPKAAKPKAERKPRVPGGDARVITLLVTGNPKKPGSATHERFKLYRTGMTVAEFLKAGGERVDLPWDEERGFIRLDAPQAEQPQAEQPQAEQPQAEQPAA